MSVATASPIVASGIQALLKRRPDIRFLPWRADPAQEGCPQTRRAVLIVDQGSTPVPIPEYLQTLKLRFPNGKFLIAGERCVREELCRLLILGAQGFVAYEDLKKSLAPAVDALWAGGLWVSPAAVKSLAEKRVEGISARAGDCMAGLTPRERQVAELLQQRLCNKEISARLNVSVATVKFHLENIFNKFGVHDRHSVVDSAAQDRAHGRVAG